MTKYVMLPPLVAWWQELTKRQLLGICLQAILQNTIASVGIFLEVPFCPSACTDACERSPFICRSSVFFFLKGELQNQAVQLGWNGGRGQERRGQRGGRGKHTVQDCSCVFSRASCLGRGSFYFVAQGTCLCFVSKKWLALCPTLLEYNALGG